MMKNRHAIRYREAYKINTTAIGQDDAQQIVSRQTAIVVDDNSIVLNLVAAMVEEMGYQIRKAIDGSQALVNLKGAPCSLVLTDYEMPGINGYQLAKIVKSQFAETRVVIMTGLCQDQIIDLMNDQDIDGWLFKPFFLEELMAVLKPGGLLGSADSLSRLTA